MATCQELSADQQVSIDSSCPELENICGTGRVIHIGDGFGIMRSLNKDKIYFREKGYLPPTKGILEVLKAKDTLCFVAKPSHRKPQNKIRWTAVKVWKPGYEPGCEAEPTKPKRSKADAKKSKEALGVEPAAELEAVSLLRSVLESNSVLNIRDLPGFVGQESPPDVRGIFSNEQKLTNFLKRHPSVFHFTVADMNVKLVAEVVQKALRFVADVLEKHGRLDLATVRAAVSEHPDETVASYGLKSKQLKTFLKRFSDVFQLLKEGDQWFVSLQRANTFCDLDDSASVVSSTSQTTFNSADFRLLSSASSMRSLSCGSSPHDSVSDLSFAESAKNQGISKMLNALLKREPMQVKNLIGYIHTSTPNVREAIGNTMEKLTAFLQNEEHFFLQKPENLVFIRRNVETRALKYLSELIVASEEGKVKLDDVLKYQGTRALPQVKAFLGKTPTEVSTAVSKMLAKEELISKCALSLDPNDNVLSFGYSGRGFASAANSGSVQQPRKDEADHGKDLPSKAAPGSSKRKSPVSDADQSENEAVEFLQRLLELDEVLTIVTVREYLRQASTGVCEILGDDDLIIAFLHRHPSVFKMTGTLNLIELNDDAIRDAIAFFSNILDVKGDLKLASLAGHMSSASPRIRRVVSGAAEKLEGFLRQYFDVFRVYGNKSYSLRASTALREKNYSGPSMTVGEVLKNSAASRMSASATGLVFSEAPRMEFTKDEVPGDVVYRRLENPSAENYPQNEPTVNPTREKPGTSTATTAETSAGLDFLSGLLKTRGSTVLKDIAQHVSAASKEVRDELGCSEKQILSFIEENPAVFKTVSGRGEMCVELISETCGDAIEFYLDVLNKRGATPVSKIHGHLSQAPLSVRTVTGGSSESVKAFLLQFPNVFKSYKADGIEVIASLYEGECESKSNGASDDENSDVAVSAGACAAESSKSIECTETTSNYRSNSVVRNPILSEWPSKSFETYGGSTLEELDLDLPVVSEKSLENFVSTEYASIREKLDQLDLAYILSTSETNLSRGAEMIRGFGIKLDEIDDSDDSTTSSNAGTANSEGLLPDVEGGLLADDRISDQAVRVVIATETDRPSVGGALQSPPLHLVASEDLSSRRNSDVAGVPCLLTCVKDEHNVICDFCLQVLSTNSGLAVDIAELLTICQKADPLRSGWQRTLHIEKLREIIRKDDRFFVNETNGGVLLVRDVESTAAAFLRQCILYYGPMVQAMLSSYDYLSSAPAEVQALLGTPGINLTQFNKKSLNSLCPKYRDQLIKKDGVFAVPQDAESDAVAFLSNLIETYGPIRVESLPGYLPQASGPVSEFLKDKLGSFETYLQSGCLGRQFLVCNGVADLVRSGNLQKNRLIVEQTAASFLINAMRLGGPIPWKETNKRLDIQKATPEVRELLGLQWNAPRLNVKRLQKFCAERTDLFAIATDGVSLLVDEGGLQSRWSLNEQSDFASRASPTGDALTCEGKQSKQTEQKAVEFLKEIIASRGAVNCKQKALMSSSYLKGAPPDVRVLLGGREDAVVFTKKCLMKFSLRHPTIFTTYKHSVDLNRSVCRLQPAGATVEPLQPPVWNQWKVSEARNLADEVGRLQQSRDSPVFAQLHSEPSFSMPSNLFTRSDAPAAMAYFPNTSVAMDTSCLHIAPSTMVAWPSFAGSYTNMPCSEVNGSFPTSVAAPLYPQLAYLPLSQVPLAPYSYEPTFGLPLNLGRPSSPVWHSLTPPGFETLQIALYPEGTYSPIAYSPMAYSPIASSPIASSPIASSPIASSPIASSLIASSPIADSLSPAIQGAMPSYAPTTKPFGNVSASHILPLATDLPSIPAQPMASLASTCIQPSVNLPFVDALDSGHHAQPFSFGTPLPLTSDQVLQDIRPLTNTSTQYLENVPNVMQPFYGTLEGAMLDSNGTHGVTEVMASEGERLEETGESENGTDLEVQAEPEITSRPENVEEFDKMESRESLEESWSLLSLAPEPDSAVTHGVMEVMASDEENIAKTQESEEARDLEVQEEPGNIPEGLEELRKVESQERLEESCSALSLAQVEDTQNNNEQPLSEVPQVSRSFEKSSGLGDAITNGEKSDISSETITNGILMEKDVEPEIVRDNSCASMSHGTLHTIVHASSSAVAILRSYEAEFANVEAGASAPCIKSMHIEKPLKVNVSNSPVTWKSTARSADLPQDFNEQFGCSFDGVSEYLLFLDEKARTADLSCSAECLSDMSETDDHYETAESDVDGEGQEFETTTGAVLSADGNQVYVKVGDDEVVRFSSENCSQHFKQCRNLGRHFAVDEGIILRYRKVPRELVSARSVCASATEDEALGPCCSELHISLGHGRVTLTGENYVVFMMSNREMSDFITVNPHRFSPDDLIHFWSTKVSGCITPWRSHSLVFTNRNGVTIASGCRLHSPFDRIPDSSPWRLTTDVGCQTDLTCGAVPTVADGRPVTCHQNCQTLSTGRIMSFGCYATE